MQSQFVYFINLYSQNMQLSKPHPSHPGYRTRPPHDVFPEDIECVLEATSSHGAIYIGNLEAAQNLQTLQKYNISSLLTACKNIHIRHPKQHVAYSLYIPGQDHQNYDLSLHFETAVNFIHQSLKQTNILVHCMAGVSRSVTLVIAYLIKHKNLSFRQAFKLVQSKRRKINPNPGFIRQLQAYQQKITKPHYSSYTQQYQRFSPTNASFVDKNRNKFFSNQNIAYDSSNYRANKANDHLKLNEKYQSYAKMIANANLQLSNTKVFNPENEQYYRPRTNYQNKQDQNSSFFNQSYYNNPTKMLREQRDQRISTTLTQITNTSSYTSNRNSNIQNLSRDLDDRINRIKQKYYEGREPRLDRSLISSEDQRVRNQISLHNSGIGRQSFNRSVYNSNNGFKPLSRQYI